MLGIIVTLVAALGGQAERIPVVLTTDCGTEVDDQWALTHLALSPRIALRAVVTTHAPGLTSERSAQVAREVLGRLRLENPPPVVAGSPVALADRSTPRRNRGVERILDATKDGTKEKPVIVLAIGAATDVASALLTDPSLPDRIEVVAMGFDRWPQGGDPWNVKNDVRAWQVVLDSRVKLVVGDEAVCKRDLAMSAAMARGLTGNGGRAGRALSDDLEHWFSAHPDLARDKTGDSTTWPIWDEVTVAHLLGLTEVREVPRPTLRDDLTFDHSSPRGTISWVTKVKRDPFWSDFATVLRAPR
jgi:inosine-uridine nucleoside N-ribohydrolase